MRRLLFLYDFSQTTLCFSDCAAIPVLSLAFLLLNVTTLPVETSGS